MDKQQPGARRERRFARRAEEGARPGSFEDAFSFSVQTLSTVDYRILSPQTP